MCPAHQESPITSAARRHHDHAKGSRSSTYSTRCWRKATAVTAEPAKNAATPTAGVLQELDSSSIVVFPASVVAAGAAVVTAAATVVPAATVVAAAGAAVVLLPPAA